MGTSRRLVILSGCALAAGCATGCTASGPVMVSPKASASPKPVRVDDIPVGGGKLLDIGDGIIVTRPDVATVKAYSASCTHEGCVITAVEAGEMVCPCHGSRFRITDGGVTRGPAKRRLDPIPVTLVDGFIHFG